ncbi:MAG: C25 family cysteine peptidase, partial [bacterium]
MKKIVFAALIMCGFAFAEVQIISSSPYGIDGILTAENPIVIDSRHAGFADILIPDGALDGDFGGPSLPAYRFLIELPAHGDASVRIANYSSVEIQITSPPSPLQPPRPKSGPKPSFAYNQELYENHSTPPIAEIIPMGIMRGRNLGILILRPLEYDSKRNILEFRKNIKFHIDYSKPLDPVPPRMASVWADRLLSTTLLSPLEVPRVFDYPSEYLIITDDYFAGHLSEYVQFKEQQGYRVNLASVDSIGADTLSIKAFVQDAYDSWDIPPDFLLIVGDVDRVPALRRGSGWTNYPTDQYYAMLDGPDYFPDIACGRMSVESLTELNAILDKTMAYGKFEFAETSWLRRFVLPACGTDGDYELCMGTHRY